MSEKYSLEVQRDKTELQNTEEKKNEPQKQEQE